jgi:hypothetical protein
MIRIETLLLSLLQINFMRPENVTPKNFIVDKIIYISPDGFFSIAIGTGDGGSEYEENTARFAMRWNGRDESKIGFPISNSKPMWFQLPKDIKDILKVLLENSRDVKVK